MQNPIQLVVNGQTIELTAGATIATLLEHLNIVSRAIAVEVNAQIQPSDRFQQHSLETGDEIEVVTLVGGG